MFYAFIYVSILMTLKQLWIGCTQVEVVPTVFRTTEREREREKVMESE